ncbi:MAG: hypothetical protein ACJ74H_14795, partial [Thermoanaerobaculia bacterium]
QELTCVAASSATEVPAGSWNVFARTARAVSSPAIVNGPTTVDIAAFTLNPAATLALQMPEAHTGVVYLPRRAIAFPASTSTQVPASEELWLLVLDKSRQISRIVPIPAVEAGTERTVDARKEGLTPSLLGWLRVGEADREALRSATDVLPPRVRAGARDADPLPAPAVLDGAFFLVRGVPAGEAELDIGGRGWLPHRIRATVGTRVVTAVTNPLLVRPAASLIVSFSTGPEVADIDRSIGSCDPSKDQPGVFEISLFACAKPDVKSCSLFRQETFGAEVPYGSFAVDDIPPGFYRAEMRFGKLPPASATVTAVALQQRPVRLHAAYTTFYGSLTHGGEPLERDATITFPNGGIGFAPKESDEYHAVVLDPTVIETDTRLDVATCGGSLRAFVLADEPWRPFSRFNIDIPDNSITINVTDTFTQMVLRAATVRYVVQSKLVPRRPVVTRTLTAGDTDHGRFVIKAVPEREIRLTVMHGGYERYEVRPFTMSKSEHKVIDVQLMPLRGTRGRIISPVPFDEGSVTWHRPSGRGETVDLGSDGTFAFESAHEAGEIMTVVSRSHPLWVLRMPAIGPKQSLELRFPDAPVREFEVKIKDVEPRTITPIGIMIGDLNVPSGALWHHQQLRDLEANVFRDILETGPIEVFVGDDQSRRQRLGPGVTELVFSPASQ